MTGNVIVAHQTPVRRIPYPAESTCANQGDIVPLLNGLGLVIKLGKGHRGSVGLNGECE